MSKRIITNFEKFNESFTEFNLQRFNSDSVQASTHVDDPQLSTNAFNRHEDSVMNAITKINSIGGTLSTSTDLKVLRSKLSLEDQDIKNIKILRINKSNNYNYNVYLSFVIDEEEYWGVISDIIGLNTNFRSEVFKDHDLVQTKEWVIKIKGSIIKMVKQWLSPEPGFYKLINNEVICFSNETCKQLVMESGIEVEIVRSYSDKIIIRYNNETYTLKGDNFIYFNWWFQKVD